AFPLLSMVAVKIALGWVFLVGGIVLIAHAFSAAQWRGLIWKCCSVRFTSSPAPIWHSFPLPALSRLQFCWPRCSSCRGGLEISMALRVRSHEGWGWLLPSGLIAVAVRPIDRARAAGLGGLGDRPAGGINLISTGWGFLVLALAGRRAAQTVAA